MFFLWAQDLWEVSSSARVLLALTQHCRRDLPGMKARVQQVQLRHSLKWQQGLVNFLTLQSLQVWDKVLMERFTTLYQN